MIFFNWVRRWTFLNNIKEAIDIPIHLPRALTPCFLRGWPQQKSPVLPVSTLLPHSVKPQAYRGNNAFNFLTSILLNIIITNIILIMIHSRYKSTGQGVCYSYTVYCTKFFKPHHHCFFFPCHMCCSASMTQNDHFQVKSTVQFNTCNTFHIHAA